MRDIKFRAWLKNGSKMVDVTGVIIDRKTISYLDNLSFKSHNYASFEDIELMQFTGLKDNYGKEIYEGDIVNIEYDNTIVKNAVIEYCGASFVGSTKSDNWELDEYWNIEVIGNIYENEVE